MIRAIVYTCAFIGAGWFGYWFYSFHPWHDTGMYAVVIAGVVAGVAAAHYEQ